jgi:hypothetical protein
MGAMSADWQTLLAVGLALGSGLWAVWSAIRPLVRPGPPCGDCGGHPAPSQLLQIDPPEDR